MSLAGTKMPGMKAVYYWSWTVIDDVTGKRRRTRFEMTEEQAKDWPGSVRVEGTRSERHCPETDAERGLLAPKSFDMPTWSARAKIVR